MGSRSHLEGADGGCPGDRLDPRARPDGLPRRAARRFRDRSVPPRSFNESTISPGLAIAGGLLGLGLAAVLGYGIYKGGIHLDLARFFRVTGAVLVIVAGGLLMTAFRTAHEAGWINFGQAQALDLTWLVHPGTTWSAMVTGILGITAHPTVVEVTVWVLYAVPMLIVVLWPQRRRPTKTASTPAPAPVAA